jgi:hypothetical protein
MFAIAPAIAYLRAFFWSGERDAIWAGVSLKDQIESGAMDLMVAVSSVCRFWAVGMMGTGTAETTVSVVSAAFSLLQAEKVTQVAMTAREMYLFMIEKFFLSKTQRKIKLKISKTKFFENIFFKVLFFVDLRKRK